MRRGIIVRWLILTVAIVFASYIFDSIRVKGFLSSVSFFLNSCINEHGRVEYIDLKRKDENIWE